MKHRFLFLLILILLLIIIAGEIKITIKSKITRQGSLTPEA